mgnify:CR=1 FL=1
MVVRVGAIGVGGIGLIELHFLREVHEVEIVGSADVSPEACALFETEFEAPAYEDYHRLLDAHAHELDGVLIATPHTHHYEQAAACLEAGVDVLLEKPMVVDVDDAVSLVEIADRTGRTLQIGYQRRFHPTFRTMKHIVDSGRIGAVHTAVCYIGQDWLTPHQGTWRVDPELSGGGQLYDTGSHLLDAFLWITGGTPETVSATIEYATPQIDVNTALSVRLGRDGETTTASLVVTGDGVTTDPREGYVFWGTHGGLAYDGEALVVEHKGATSYTAKSGAAASFDSATRAKVEHFVDRVAGRADANESATDAVQVTALTEAAYRAADEGRTVDVQELLSTAEAAVT